MGFDFDEKTRRELGYKLIDQVNEYFSSLPERPVQLPLEQRTFGALTDRMPEVGDDAARVLEDVIREMIDKGFHVPSANYFGLMNPTPTYVAVLAEALVAAINPQLATLARSQLASKIEKEVVRWIGERVGWNGTTAFDGTFTSGGNEANFSGLALALAHKFPGAVEDGVASIGAQPTVYASGESHHSLDKSVGLLGLGRKSLRRVELNERVQVDPGLVEDAIKQDLAAGHKPFAIVATAGTTNSGAIDDIAALAELAQRYGLWLHVDGAYGGAAIFSEKHRGLVRGIEKADSITLDPHKWLSMPFAAGIILTRHPQALEDAFGVVTPYMPRTKNPTQIDNFKIGVQWSRRMNSLKFYLTLRVHGRKAYEELIDRQLRLAASFADWVRGSGSFELGAPQVLPIVNFRVQMPGAAEADVEAANQAIVEEVTRDGVRWISHTHVNRRSVIRMMVISYLTEERHLTQLQEALTAAADKFRAAAVSRRA